MMVIQLYDTTLRDGAQREGISLSLNDKLKIVRKLDELGIHYVEGGWPGSNPKDAEFFAQVKEMPLEQAVITAFGSTRRAHTAIVHDANIRALLEAETPAVAIFGKSWRLHVTEVLGTTLDENLAMIADSVSYVKGQGREVIYDAEHFFDGYKADPAYALQTLQMADRAGADCLVLCDTNGGTLPSQLVAIIEEVKKVTSVPLGIHAHNDSDLAVANSLAAVQAGVVHVQGTINGYGERSGNANLCSIIPNLKLKLGHDCISDEQLRRLVRVSRYVSELANLAHDAHLPYVGHSAFAHKGGMHVNALLKCEESYQHIDPSLVGNHKRVVVSELSGKSNIAYKIEEFGLNPSLGPDQTREILQQVKDLERQGFQFEGAEGSLELLIRRAQPGYKPPFELMDFHILVESRQGRGMLAEAAIKVRVDDEVMHTAAEGNGPVNALDLAARKALLPFYPQLAEIHLTDYKVRILDSEAGTEAQVRVLIDSACGARTWSTVGSSTNIIEASWQALADSLEYGLLNGLGNGKRSQWSEPICPVCSPTLSRLSSPRVPSVPRQRTLPHC